MKVIRRVGQVRSGVRVRAVGRGNNVSKTRTQKLRSSISTKNNNRTGCLTDKEKDRQEERENNLRLPSTKKTAGQERR